MASRLEQKQKKTIEDMAAALTELEKERDAALAHAEGAEAVARQITRDALAQASSRGDTTSQVTMLRHNVEGAYTGGPSVTTRISAELSHVSTLNGRRVELSVESEGGDLFVTFNDDRFTLAGWFELQHSILDGVRALLDTQR